MSKQTAFTVSEVARRAGVSVRALHHYDEIGLLRPSGRSDAGYRLYAIADLARLKQIMSFRLLGFPLEEIGRLLDAEDFDLQSALALQRGLLVKRRDEVDALIAAIDATLEELKGERNMENNFDAFAGFDPSSYEAEVDELWGDTDAFRESARRVARYGEKDCATLKTEAEGIYAALAAELAKNTAPSDPRVLALVERHRLHIDRWFYPCSPRMHAQLGALYASDPRYAKSIDKGRPGVCAFLCAALSEWRQPT